MSDRDFWEANAETVFARRYDDDWPLWRIAAECSTDERSVSAETVRKLLLGLTHADVTETLRGRYEPQMRRPVEPLTDSQLQEVFVAYHEHQQSLSRIARTLGDGWDYARVRRVLTGDGEYQQPTADLRSRFPDYTQRTGRGARGPVPKWKLTKAFRLYFESDYSLNDIRDETGIPREQFRALVVGEEDPHRTRELRERYGSELRPPGRPKTATG